MTTRPASHAGSWYSDDGAKLSQELDIWLNRVPNTIEGVELPPKGARVIIAPHAGYAYSGQAAAYAYRCLDVSGIKRIFVLGPSHHVYLDCCAVTACDYYQTPLGDLAVDTAVEKELVSNPDVKFEYMSAQTDEEEHSLEMQMPYIYKILQQAGKEKDTKVVPIMVGAINCHKEKEYGKLMARYLEDPENAFVVSTDFCHWGTRFSFTHYYLSLPEAMEVATAEPVLEHPFTHLKGSIQPPGPHYIHESIEALDRLGMRTIESGKHDDFEKYLRETKNTICGRHPIGIVLAAFETLGKGKFKFVRYEQSTPVTLPNDSSVSYASAYAVV